MDFFSHLENEELLTDLLELGRGGHHHRRYGPIRSWELQSWQRLNSEENWEKITYWWFVDWGFIIAEFIMKLGWIFLYTSVCGSLHISRVLDRDCWKMMCSFSREVSTTFSWRGGSGGCEDSLRRRKRATCWRNAKKKLTSQILEVDGGHGVVEFDGGVQFDEGNIVVGETIAAVKKNRTFGFASICLTLTGEWIP